MSLSFSIEMNRIQSATQRKMLDLHAAMLKATKKIVAPFTWLMDQLNETPRFQRYLDTHK